MPQLDGKGSPRGAVTGVERGGEVERVVIVHRTAVLACVRVLKLSVLTLSQRLVTPRTPRISGARLGVQPLQLPEIPIHYKWGPQ